MTLLRGISDKVNVTHIQTLLVRRGPLGGIDHEDVDGAARWDQLQPELFLRRQ